MEALKYRALIKCIAYLQMLYYILYTWINHIYLINIPAKEKNNNRADILNAKTV